MSTSRIALTFAATWLAACSAAYAQSSSYRTAQAESGRVVRLQTVTPLKKDCSVGTLGGVKVVTPPKNGALNLRQAKTKTPAGYRCPNVELTAEFVLYRSKPNFTGSDEVVFETKNGDGAVERISIRIEIGAAAATPAGQPKKEPALEL